jgi:glucose-6-phosphate 1-dehydrogenase
MSKFVMIIFGASGDLTKRKLIPALYNLYKDNRLPEGFAVLGIGRTGYRDDTYRTYIRTEMERFVASEEHAGGRMTDFAIICTIFRLIRPRLPIMEIWMPVSGN